MKVIVDLSLHHTDFEARMNMPFPISRTIRDIIADVDDREVVIDMNEYTDIDYYAVPAVSVKPGYAVLYATRPDRVLGLVPVTKYLGIYPYHHISGLCEAIRESIVKDEDFRVSKYYIDHDMTCKAEQETVESIFGTVINGIADVIGDLFSYDSSEDFEDSSDSEPKVAADSKAETVKEKLNLNTVDGFAEVLYAELERDLKAGTVMIIDLEKSLKKFSKDKNIPEGVSRIYEKLIETLKKIKEEKEITESSDSEEITEEKSEDTSEENIEEL